MYLLSVDSFWVKLIKIYISIWRVDRKRFEYIYLIMNKEKFWSALQLKQGEKNTS